MKSRNCLSSCCLICPLNHCCVTCAYKMPVIEVDNGLYCCRKLLFWNNTLFFPPQVVRMVAGNMETGLLYSRIIPLVLLLVDGCSLPYFSFTAPKGFSITLKSLEHLMFNQAGSSPIDVTDSRWELYLLIQKKCNEQAECQLIGFAAVYRFYHYSDGSRLRLSQVIWQFHYLSW